MEVFVGLTLFIMGTAASLTGAALAGVWRPFWQVLPAALLLGCVDRFLIYALFEGELLNFAGTLTNTLVLCGIASIAYRRTWVRQMTGQYPWLYAKTTPLTYREKQ